MLIPPVMSRDSLRSGRLHNGRTWITTGKAQRACGSRIALESDDRRSGQGSRNQREDIAALAEAAGIPRSLAERQARDAVTVNFAVTAGDRRGRQYIAEDNGRFHGCPVPPVESGKFG